MADSDRNMTDLEYENEVIDFLWPNELELATVPIFITLFCIGLIGNSMVVFVVIRNQSMRTATNIFLVSAPRRRSQCIHSMKNIPTPCL